MNKVLLVALALSISTTVATTAMSLDKPVATTEQAEKKVTEIKWAGAVVSVDAAARTVIAKNKKGEMTFDVAKATFAKGVQLDELKAGDRVTFRYEVKDGKHMVTTAKAKHAKARKAVKHETAGQYVDDSVITTKIKTAILEEAALKSLQINVKTYKGVVQLSGFVDSTQSIAKAGEIAGRVSGVKEVKNDLIVK